MSSLNGFAHVAQRLNCPLLDLCCLGQDKPCVVQGDYCCTELDWPSLQQRRELLVLAGVQDIDFDEYFLFSPRATYILAPICANYPG